MDRRTFSAGLLASVGYATGVKAQASWPRQPIKLIIPFPAGNTADIVARIIQPGLAQRLGQPVVVDNRAGAGGSLGVSAVAKADDGHSFLLTTASPLVINPAVYKTLPYSVETDLAPIGKLGSISVMLIGKKDLPASTVAELIAHVKANAGKLDYASVGAGTFTHLTMELFRKQAGFDIQHVPFRGASAAHAELISGRVALMFDSIASANAQVRGGQVKPFAVTSATRSPFAPDVPTIAELKLPGLDDFNVGVWIGTFAPTSTPPEIVSRLEVAIRAEMAEPEVVAKLNQQSINVEVSENPVAFMKLVLAEKAQWTQVAREIKLEPL
jgi:tripartite-type tricarboxylate transporter receptor subunit TctC